MCDTFIALPSATLDGSMIFAKNSDRPAGEGQTTVLFPEADYAAGELLTCTYIKIPQVGKTQRVLLSKIDWMWGVEMGANGSGVVIGNEAVWTNLAPGPPALLGMDLVRLGLERGASARQALNVITSLLEDHGQGGACAQNDPGFTYDNSFLIADFKECWVLETAGRHWAAQRIMSSVHNISNRLSIRKDYDFCSAGLAEFAHAKGICVDGDRVDFAGLFSGSPLDMEQGSREHRGARQLAGQAKHITAETMKALLRDHQAGICMHGGFETTASMVSQIYSNGKMRHWLTDGPHPCRASYRHVDEFD